MQEEISKIQGLLKSQSIKSAGTQLLDNFIGILTKDPVSLFKMLLDLKSLPSTLRDGIFWECFETYIMNVYRFNDETFPFESAGISSLAVILADASPNHDANYDGNPELLYEYAKRLIKLIDECGTKQKAVYLANLTRALISHQIDTKQFFQLSRCIRNLTEEDLSFLSTDISERKISGDEDFIDDYRALSLVYEAEENFAYSKRAFLLKKYALLYEQHNIRIPTVFPKRRPQLLLEDISPEEIKNMFQETKELKDAQEWQLGI